MRSRLKPADRRPRLRRPPGLVELGIDGGDQEFRGGADGLQRLFELGAIDFVGGEVVAGDVFDPEVAHDDVGNGFGFEFALLSVFGDGIGLLVRLWRSSCASSCAITTPALAVGERLVRMTMRPPAE
jgi:hypothetical protein